MCQSLLASYIPFSKGCGGDSPEHLQGDPSSSQWPECTGPKLETDSDIHWHPDTLVQLDADGHLNWKITGARASAAAWPASLMEKQRLQQREKPWVNKQKTGTWKFREKAENDHGTLRETKKDSLVSDFLVRISARPATLYFLSWMSKSSLAVYLQKCPFPLS